MWLTARRSIIAVIAILPFGFAGPAYACLCMGPASAAEHLEDSTVAFRGRAVRAGPVGSTGGQVTEFEVIETLKGQPTETLQVSHVSASVCCFCGVSFELGHEYFILAREHEGQFHTSSCDLARFPIAEYREALAEIEAVRRLLRAF